MSTEIPWSESTEQSLLGAVLLKPEILAWLEVSPACFHGLQNKAVHAAMASLHARSHAIDEITLEAELERTGTLKAIGGVAYLGKLACLVPTSANAASYAATLEELRVTREAMRAIAGVQARIQDGLNGEALLDALGSELAGIKRRPANELTAISDTSSEMYRRLLDDVDARAKGETRTTSFIPTGIAEVDQQIDGFPRGTVSGLGGRPGKGKSSFAAQAAAHAATLGATVAIFTTEDPRDRWTERLMAKYSLVSVDRIYNRDLGPSELGAVANAAEKLKRLKNLHIIHAHGMGAQDVIRAATALGADMAIVDYVQKLKAPESRMKLHDAIEANSKALGDFAGSSNAAIVVLSQLSKDIERENRRPTLSDLRYGDGLAQEVKLMMLLHDPQDSDPMLREIIVATRNQGRSDMRIRVRFDGAHCRYLEPDAY
jgi:replicative DNA helicase